MNRAWSKLGGQLGLGCIAIGILVIGLAWNGAAGVDFVSGQIPYLLSGGALGLALVGIGICFIVVQNARRDRSILEAQLQDLTASVNRLANAMAGGAGAVNGQRTERADVETVVVGRGSYHRPDCRLVQGKDLETTTPDAAAADGLTPCRICNPADLRPVEV